MTADYPTSGLVYRANNPTSECPLHPDAPTPCAPCGVNRVRAALTVAPRTRRDRDDDPNPTRARAIARARTERTNAKEDGS